jgi:UDP-N-acetylmuramate dehydrogenase
LNGGIRALITGSIRGDVLTDEPLSRHTALRVGGPADIFAVPADMADLRELLNIVAERGTASLVIGGGYNLLVKDGGFRGVVISLQKLRRLEARSDNRIYAEAGAHNGALVLFAVDKELTGLEFLTGIPGTVGGAIAMNAGAHGEAVQDRLETLTTLDGGALRTRGSEELIFGYRSLALYPAEIVVAGVFHLAPGSAAEIKGRIEGFVAHRRNFQRVSYPNAGSFFKNPAGAQAWRLIDEAGLRGYRIGGAQVSEAHTNFLVNRGGAAAKDFLELSALIKERVKAASGITLEEEVRIVGED